MDQFAGYLAGVAQLGPDAIEVWNEPNLDREWPRGQISGAMYTTLLAKAYNAIKGATPASWSSARLRHRPALKGLQLGSCLER